MSHAEREMEWVLECLLEGRRRPSLEAAAMAAAPCIVHQALKQARTHLSDVAGAGSGTALRARGLDLVGWARRGTAGAVLRAMGGFQWSGGDLNRQACSTAAGKGSGLRAWPGACASAGSRLYKPVPHLILVAWAVGSIADEGGSLHLIARAVLRLAVAELQARGGRAREGEVGEAWRPWIQCQPTPAGGGCTCWKRHAGAAAGRSTWGHMCGRSSLHAPQPRRRGPRQGGTQNSCPSPHLQRGTRCSRRRTPAEQIQVAQTARMSGCRPLAAAATAGAVTSPCIGPPGAHAQRTSGRSQSPSAAAHWKPLGCLLSLAGQERDLPSQCCSKGRVHARGGG